jgi:GNAT superfamily N-acetyltransferase
MCQLTPRRLTAPLRCYPDGHMADVEAMTHVQIRNELDRDLPAIRHVNQEAFGTAAEGAIIDVVRANATPIVSLVAEAGDAIVGHILFSPVTVDRRADLLIMGLAPMAVLPSRQRQGIGTALVEEGLALCRRLGAVGVVVSATRGSIRDSASRRPPDSASGANSMSPMKCSWPSNSWKARFGSQAG